jgi:hypothetical protein
MNLKTALELKHSREMIMAKKNFDNLLRDQRIEHRSLKKEKWLEALEKRSNPYKLHSLSYYRFI